MGYVYYLPVVSPYDACHTQLVLSPSKVNKAVKDILLKG